MNRRAYRVFVSSPSDVRPERAIAERVVAKLAREFAHHCDVDAVIWEHEPLLASLHFQDRENIPPPSRADFCITILWSTLGVKLPPEKFRGAISCETVTGTEWEFEDALHSLRLHGHPKLMFYQKTAEVLASLSDDAALEERRRQKRAVDAFVSRWFKSADNEASIAAHTLFATTAEFEAKVETHLRALLLRRVADDLGLQAETGTITWTGPPWPALAAFTTDQAPIFFGRGNSRNALRELLATQAQAGKGFVLVIGASGAGKSSLVRAGLLPDLLLPGMIGNVALVRSCIMRPSDAGADPLRALSAAMFSASALPELADLQYREETLAAQLRQAPQSIKFAVEQGLARAAEGKLTTLGQARLVLVADQLEELFTIEAISAQARDAFVEALSALARSGAVWVVGTLRADFFAHLEHVPALARLSEGGRYLLLPPDLAELSEIASKPARAAGLHFEVDAVSGTSLGSVIVAAAARNPGALPLLSFALDALDRSLHLQCSTQAADLYGRIQANL
jgi:hypothetical protein